MWGDIVPKYSFYVKVDNRKKFLDKLPGACKKTLEQIGDKIVKHVKEKVPVDTGALRDSYMKDVDVYAEYLVRVGSPLAYAPFMELGTGPNYEDPPDWVTNNAQRGHQLFDPWWYMDDDGEWHLGWFVRAQPHLRPAFTDHVDEYMEIFKRNLKNA